MSRARVAAVLGAVAALAVVVTAVIAAGTYAGGDDAATEATAPDPEPLTIRDPASGATFEVPARDWVVKDRAVRIYYADGTGRPTALVRGPAVYRDRDCTAAPAGSNRGFAGFARQPFAAWVRGVAGAAPAATTGTDRASISLADGTPAVLTRTALRLADDGDPCSAAAVEVAMVRAGDVRVVLVRDDLETDTLPREAVEQILTSLRLG